MRYNGKWEDSVNDNDVQALGDFVFINGLLGTGIYGANFSVKLSTQLLNFSHLFAMSTHDL